MVRPGGRILLVVYDVSDDSRRLKLSRTLEAWGLSRVQRSAFAGRLQPARMRDLARIAARIIDEETDVVHMVSVPWEEWARAIVLGTPWGGRVELRSAQLLR